MAGHVHVHRSDPPDQELLAGQRRGSAEITLTISAARATCVDASSSGPADVHDDAVDG